MPSHRSGLVLRSDRSLTVAALIGAASVRSCERVGWQAKAPAPQGRKPLRSNVGQTLSSVNPSITTFFSHLLRGARHLQIGKSWLAGESACPTRAQALAQQRGTDAFVCQPVNNNVFFSPSEGGEAFTDRKELVGRRKRLPHKGASPCAATWDRRFRLSTRQ